MGRVAKRPGSARRNCEFWYRFDEVWRDEARAYLDHPVLGARLVEGVAAVNAVQGRTAHEIFGSPDDRKFQSCLTLFEQVASAPEVFAAALDRYYGGERDARTLEALGVG